MSYINMIVPMIKVDVCGSELEAGKEGETVWVSIRRVCEALELTEQGQLTKLRGKSWARVTMIVTQMPGDDQRRETACIPLKALPMWLATINASKVDARARPTLERFQMEAADVLADHFLGGHRRRSAPARMMSRAERRARLIHRLVKDLSPACTQARDAILVATVTGLLAGADAERTPPGVVGTDLGSGYMPGVGEVPVPAPTPPLPGPAGQVTDAAVEGWSLRGLLRRFEEAGMVGLKTTKIRMAAESLGLVGDSRYGRYSQVKNEHERVLARNWRYNEQAGALLEQTLRSYLENVAAGVGEPDAMARAVGVIGRVGSGGSALAPLKVIRAPA